jgi:sulfide:quinone oxidoreductase
MLQEGKTVLVLGGGVGGLVTANELRKQLQEPHRVVVIERSTTHLFYPSLLWLMIGQRKLRAIRCQLATSVQKRIEVVQGEITAWLQKAIPGL